MRNADLRRQGKEVPTEMRREVGGDYYQRLGISGGGSASKMAQARKDLVGYIK